MIAAFRRGSECKRTSMYRSNMQLKSGNGDVTIKKADLQMQIALSDGDIQIDNSSFNGDMKINSSCGDVSVE